MGFLDNLSRAVICQKEKEDSGTGFTLCSALIKMTYIETLYKKVNRKVIGEGAPG